jgi:hypothetical protein
MNALGKLLRVLLALTLVALAVPGYAATKLFSLSVTAMSTGYTASFNNLSNGNSYINSMNITIPSNLGANVTNVVVQPSLVTGNTKATPNCSVASPCIPGTTILISDISGIAPNTSGSIDLTTSAQVDLQSCGNTYQWSARAFTGNAGNSGGGTSFNASPGPGVIAFATSTVSCTLQFDRQPTNAQIGNKITSVSGNPAGDAVTIKALIGGSVAASFTGPITLTLNQPAGGGGTLTSAMTITGGVATLTSLSVDTIGTYSLKASASGFNDATSNSFKIFDGILDCGQSFGSKFTSDSKLADTEPGWDAGMRNAYNKDGVAEECVPVLYTFTNMILASNTVNLTWDMDSQRNAAFMYQINWGLRPVETTGGLTGWTVTPRPQVAWLNVDGSLTTLGGNPQYVPALACLSDRLPAPYGVLAADVLPTDTQIQVKGIAANPASSFLVPAPGAPALPATPFPIVIANTAGGAQLLTTERMTVTSVGTPVLSGGTYSATFTVTRGTAAEGDPTGTGKAAHTRPTGKDLRVMSTPLPIIPASYPAPYVVQTQAHMCIADHGFIPYDGFGVGGALTGATRLLYRTTVFDIGDGWVRIGNF